MPKYTYAMSGDLGDVVYSLRTCHYLDDPTSIYYLVDRPFTKAWNKSRLDALIPLMNEQPYIGAAIHAEFPKEPTHNFTDFRKYLPFGKTLSEIHAEWVGIKLPPYTPWLFVNKPSSEMAGKVLVHKSPRYPNPAFPWRALADKFGDRMVALGLKDEHHVIQQALGRDIPLRETTSYLEMAQLLAGCNLFIGNQSSPCSIALGLGIPVVQETCQRQPDCIFPGANAFFGISSYVVIDGVTYGVKTTTYIDPTILPPKGWIVTTEDGKRFKSHSINMISNDIKAHTGMDKKEISEMILSKNTERVRRDYPDFQNSREVQVSHLVKNCCQDVKTNLQY
jgi:hypothetical protein